MRTLVSLRAAATRRELADKMKELRYNTGEPILPGDSVLIGEEHGEVDYTVTEDNRLWQSYESIRASPASRHRGVFPS